MVPFGLGVLNSHKEPEYKFYPLYLKGVDSTVGNVAKRKCGWRLWRSAQLSPNTPCAYTPRNWLLIAISHYQVPSLWFSNALLITVQHRFFIIRIFKHLSSFPPFSCNIRVNTCINRFQQWSVVRYNTRLYHLIFFACRLHSFVKLYLI